MKIKVGPTFKINWKSLFSALPFYLRASVQDVQVDGAVVLTPSAKSVNYPLPMLLTLYTKSSVVAPVSPALKRNLRSHGFHWHPGSVSCPSLYCFLYKFQCQLTDLFGCLKLFINISAIVTQLWLGLEPKRIFRVLKGIDKDGISVDNLSISLLSVSTKKCLVSWNEMKLETMKIKKTDTFIISI